MTFRPFSALVEDVARISPNFIRLTLGGDLADFGPAPGVPVRDLRIKLMLPTDDGHRPVIADTDSWYEDWRAMPEEERGYMRTFSVRELRRDPDGTRLVVDVVRHLDEGASGPASRFAASARPGDGLTVIGPDRTDDSEAGIEFQPRPGEAVALFADETAVPAACRILEDLPADATGSAFLEVPTEADRLPVDAPAGVGVTWLVRDGAEHGSLLAGSAGATVTRDDSPELPWIRAEERRDGNADNFCWIAGEASMVTTLRRHLVATVGVDKSRVAFMGYWKIGVAMRG